MNKHGIGRTALALLLANIAVTGAPAGITAVSAQGASPAATSVPSEALRTAADDVTRPFYEARNWQAAWSPASVEVLRGALDDRSRHGLDRLVFLGGDLPANDPAARDAALTKAALRYAVALSSGVSDPTQLHQIYTLPRAQADLIPGLNRALDSGSLAQWLNGLAPQGEAYRVLSEAYLQTRANQPAQSSQPIASGGLIERGEQDERVPAVAQRLVQLGYLGGVQGGTTYTDQLASAVERLQADYGLAIDGIVGPDTLEALNFDAKDRARVLAVGLERLRWLERDPPATRIDVNIAGAELGYYRDGALIGRRNVVVGEPKNPTPQLQSNFYRLVANPTWTIPKSIERNELANVSAAYLRRNNMTRRNGWIVQESGPDNALGLVKFDLDNEYAIYLHDTNARQLLDKSQRYLSHGCVRVEDALEFAEMLARDANVSEEWRQARAEGEQTFVPLPESIPVRLIYHDVFVRDGKPVYRLDPYGWNGQVAAKLGFDSDGLSRRVRISASDIGP